MHLDDNSLMKKETEEYLEVFGARVHNLKNIDVSIPRNKLVVITGLSGSGKSSLAFDTIFAEGQRRYMESFAAYARQFLGNYERPDVDKINGLSPVISIEQKTVSKNPRSTVGTITEVYDFLRLLYARSAEAYSYVTGEKMIKYTEQQILDCILNDYNEKKIYLLAPIVKGRKGHYRELIQNIRKQGYLRVRIDGEIIDVTEKIQLDRYKIHDIDIVVDRIIIDTNNKERIYESLKTALKLGKGVIMITELDAPQQIRHFSKNLMCPTSGIAYGEPEPNLFSFNSPYGACNKCGGLGTVPEIDIKKIIPNPKKNIYNGGIAPLGEFKNNWIYKQIEAIGEKYGFTIKTPIENIAPSGLNVVLYGSEEVLKIKNNYGGETHTYSSNFEGVINFILRQHEENPSKSIEKWAESFMNKITCNECNGSRLRKEALYFKIGNKNIADLALLDIKNLYEWSSNVEHTLEKNKKIIAHEILKEINARLNFLLDVGLDYLNLNRTAKTLSGGEAQRIRLATQIGSQLVNVLYILDEPSIGLHQRDNNKLIKSLCNLRDLGNSVIVVEHDKEIMLASDWIIDIGPKAGIHGGKIVGEGTPKDFLKQKTLTSNYLNNKLQIEIPLKRRSGNGKKITLQNAHGNNLKNISVDFPLGKIICITGVSGSGKSSLIHGTLYPLLKNYLYFTKSVALPHGKLTGIENIDKVIEVDQSPIGRTPRSNPATYTGVFSDIRTLFTLLPEAKIRGYKPGRFSFNVKGGRCETCMGAGVKTIEMNFLPDVYVECNDCSGKRYNRETQEVRYKGKSISDVLDMTIDYAVEFFNNIPSILNKIKTLQDVGLGYVKLGQPSTTLSGGEAQRIKLATELAKKATGKTLYIMDEPTTGLHFEDIRVLMNVLNKLADTGNTILIIEHNLDIIKCADHIIDLGLEGGEKGGQLLYEGTPEDMFFCNNSITAPYLKEEFILYRKNATIG